MFNKKSKQIISRVIIVLLILAMIIPMLVSIVSV